MRLFSSYIAPVLLCIMLSPMQLASAESTSSSAIHSLLKEAKQAFESERYELAASILERALRIDQHNPVLWHNLAGISLKQKKWAKAASLATKSNTFVTDTDRYLRARNWVVIATACRELGNQDCMTEAQRRVGILSGRPLEK